MEEDIGTATIVYDDPEAGTVERTLANEHLAYFQDHWILKTADEGERDTVRRVPLQRVHYVEREVDAFEEEVKTLRSQVESFADDIRSKVLGGRGGEDGDAEVTRIDVETGEQR